MSQGKPLDPDTKGKICRALRGRRSALYCQLTFGVSHSTITRLRKELGIVHHAPSVVRQKRMAKHEAKRSHALALQAFAARLQGLPAAERRGLALRAARLGNDPAKLPPSLAEAV